MTSSIISWFRRYLSLHLVWLKTHVSCRKIFSCCCTDFRVNILADKTNWQVAYTHKCDKRVYHSNLSGMKIWRYYFPCVNITWGSEITYPWLNVLVQMNLSWFKRDMKGGTSMITKLYISFIYTCPYEISDNGCSILYLFLLKYIDPWHHLNFPDVTAAKLGRRLPNMIVVF